jgi:hypothetical protein
MRGASRHQSRATVEAKAEAVEAHRASASTTNESPATAPPGGHTMAVTDRARGSMPTPRVALQGECAEVSSGRG